MNITSYYRFCFSCSALYRKFHWKRRFWCIAGEDKDNQQRTGTDKGTLTKKLKTQKNKFVLTNICSYNQPSCETCIHLCCLLMYNVFVMSVKYSDIFRLLTCIFRLESKVFKFSRKGTRHILTFFFFLKKDFLPCHVSFLGYLSVVSG